MRCTLQEVILISTFIGFVSAAPGGGFIAAGAVKPPITFDGGNVGVNFGGYHASAGLGGLLSGGAAGGLHAEAGTPYGQSAGAGLGGVVVKGKTVGGLYAGADSGAGAAAEAAIGGVSASSGAIGGSISGAPTGEAYVSKSVKYDNPVVVEEVIQDTPQIHKSYVERTVIPNYVEKTVQVPSYVEKTIRVPTVVEKKIRVPAPPTIIEQTVNAPSKHTNVEVSAGVAADTGVNAVTVIRKHRPFVHKYWAYRKPLFGGFFAGGIGGAAGAGSYDSNYHYGGGYGGGSATYAVRKSVSPDLVDAAFNIPISTLTAVNKLVGGIVGGGSGSLSVSKQLII